MDIHMIAAMDGQGAIGKDGTMAWYVPQELHHFKKLTMDGVLIMGRVTYESIGRTLPGRVSIIVSRGANPGHEAAPNMHWVLLFVRHYLWLLACTRGKKSG